jgi:hypothetical protein
MKNESIKTLLEKKLKEFTFDYEDNDISGVMHLLDTEEDMQKMYDFIVNNNITDIDDIYEYGFELYDDLDEIAGVEEGPKVVDGVLGHAVGDALGTPVQFKDRDSLFYNPVKDMRRSYAGDKGTWSDDTSMEIATIDSFINCNGWDYDDIMINFYDWLNDGKYTARGNTFDVGRTCLRAIKSFYNGNTTALESGLCDNNSNGNGSLMRILPIAYYSFYKKIPNNDIYELVKNISSLTHRHEISILGCYIYVLYVIKLLQGKDKLLAYNMIRIEDYSMFSEESLKAYSRILKDDLNALKVDDIKSSGYVVATLEASLWIVLKSDNYKESIIGAVNLGGDTDTIGAITGSMTGIIYGYDSIPKDWLKELARREYLEDLAMKFESAIK